MTASELLQHLQQLPPDAKIVIRGYEEGFNDILHLRNVKIKIKNKSHSYEGQYDYSNDADAIDAIDLFGENKNAEDS